MKKLVILMGLIAAGVSSFAQSAKELTQKGMELYEKREFMEAILNLNKAIDTDKKYAQAYFVRGNIKAVFEDYHGAMKDYNSAIESNSKFAECYFERGKVKMNLQDYYGAIADFTSAISLNENFVEAYYSRGKAKQFLQANNLGAFGGRLPYFLNGFIQIFFRGFGATHLHRSYFHWARHLRDG